MPATVDVTPAEPVVVVSLVLPQKLFQPSEILVHVSDAFSPVSGEVIEFNEAVEADSSLVNKDPYGEGWLVKIKMSNPAEVDGLLDAAAYEALIG